MAPAESPPAAADINAERPAAMGGLVSPSMSEAAAWLDEIKTLWRAGKKEQARLELQAFLQRYPDYATGELLKKLDPELVNALLPDPD